MLDCALSEDLMVQVALEWLSPREQRRLAATCARCRSLLPPLLRIQIGSSTTNHHPVQSCQMGGDFFVTPILHHQPDHPPTIPKPTTLPLAVVPSRHQHHPFRPPNTTVEIPAPLEARPFELRSRPLDENEVLYFDQPYALWRFDEEEHSPVYLGRHLRQTDQQPPGKPSQYHFTLGLAPDGPFQAWTFVATTSPEGGTKGPRTPVSNASFSLRVHGTNPRSGQPDSCEKHVLVCRMRTNHEGGPTWAWFTKEEEQDEPSPGPPSSTRALEEEGTRPSTAAWTSDQLFVRKASDLPALGRPMAVFPLATQAIPEITDKGAYNLYRPERWKAHLSPCCFSSSSPSKPPTLLRTLPYSGRSAVIEFSFWAEETTLYFRAFHLPFSLAVPIMDLDRTYFSPQLGPIANLFASYSARWNCIKYYMATAADVGEGCPLHMGRFLEGVTDHEEHQVDYDESKQVVSILMKVGHPPKTTDHDDDRSQEEDPPPPILTTVPRDDTRVWRFFFSW